MTRDEFATFAAAIRTYFVKEKILPDNKAMELWYMQLQDLDYEVASLALGKWVSTNKWSPSIAELRQYATSITLGSVKDWGEAWEEVRKAIRKYGQYNEPEALESLDELTREAVKRLGFKHICISEEIEIERANFRMIYEKLAQRKTVDNQLPPKVKEMIEMATERLTLEPPNELDGFKIPEKNEEIKTIPGSSEIYEQVKKRLHYAE